MTKEGEELKPDRHKDTDKELGKKVHSSHYSTWDGRLTSAEQSINPASVCFMR